MDFKVLLIKPNILVRKGFDLHSRMSPPIGLAYIASPLLKAGVQVEIIDMVAEAPAAKTEYGETHDIYGLTNFELLGILEQKRPDLVGIGGFTSQFGCVKRIVSAVKSFSPSLPVVLGGVNATALPLYVLEQTAADYVVMGEGEKAMMELVSSLRSGDLSSLVNINGFAWKDVGGEIKVNKKTEFIADIDEIAWPARELFKHEVYIRDGVSMPVISSRSCPGRCTFCSVHQMTGYKWRGREPDDVVDEIEYLAKEWGYETVSIFDDAANVIPERLIKICREVVRRNLRVRLVFPSSLILKHVTKDLLYWMKKAGSVGLSLPIEHSDQVMRNVIMKKSLDLAHVDNVLQWCRELKLLTIGNFVIGMPGENEATLQGLETYVRKIAKRIDAVSVYAATPFPGTRFYRECLESGMLKDPEANEFLDFDTYTVHVSTPEMPIERILFYKNKIESAFREERGDDFPADYIRRVFRKPDAAGLDYLEKCYFASFS